MAEQKTTQNSPDKKNNKITKITGYLFMIIFIVLSGVLIFQVFKFNILPTKYIAVLVAILLLLIGALGYVQLAKRMSNMNKILGQVMTLILCVLLGFGNYYFHVADATFDNLTDNKSVNTVSVIVLNESKASSITDLKTGTFGRSEAGTQTVMTKALADITDEVGKTISPEAYDSTEELGNDLLSGKIDAIVLDESMRSFFTDIFDNFDKTTKVIWTNDYEKEAEVNTKNVAVTSQAFNLYITGMDTYGPVETEGRSDVNLVLTVNPTTHEILMTSIPRDYYIPQTCQNNQADKLTHTGVWGVSCTLSSVENYFDIDLNYYARVNFTGIWDIIDAIGGVDIDNPYEFTGEAGNFHFEKGKIHLSGEQALCYARERKSFLADDSVRIKNQERVLEGIIQKAISPAILMRYTSIMDAVGNALQTNMTKDEMNALVRMQIDTMPGWKIHKIAVTGEDQENVYSPANGAPAWVMMPYEQSVKDAVNIIKQLEAGNDIDKLVEAFEEKNFVNDDYASTYGYYTDNDNDGVPPTTIPSDEGE